MTRRARARAARVLAQEQELLEETGDLRRDVWNVVRAERYAERMGFEFSAELQIDALARGEFLRSLQVALLFYVLKFPFRSFVFVLVIVWALIGRLV